MPTLSARKKADIIQAAIAEFQQNGFSGTSMDAIALKAKVSKRTVYNHFPSKQALFETIAHEVWLKANEATALVFNPSAPIKAQLKALALKELQVFCDDEVLQLTRVLMVELMQDSAMAQQILARFDEEESSLSVWMQAAKQSGALNVSEPQEAGAQFHGLIKAQAFWPQLMFNQPVIANSQHDKLAEQVCTMFLAVFQCKKI